jgi:Fur family transcriptional regulator, peroxide stress response regulator
MKQTQPSSAAVRLKRTPQRRAIMECLEGDTSHPSAEELFRRVSKRRRPMSFATVYNTLHALTRAGALRELTIDPRRKRYDPDTSRHNHYICDSCGKIGDVPEEFQIEPPKGIEEDFTVLGNHVEFYGRCASCAKKALNGEASRQSKKSAGRS